MSGGSSGGAIAATSGGGAGAVLTARDLGRSYDGYIALGSFTFAVEAGEFVALIGPNGAGKTTFLNLAAGLLEPTAGRVEVADRAGHGLLAARTVEHAEGDRTLAGEVAVRHVGRPLAHLDALGQGPPHLLDGVGQVAGEHEGPAVLGRAPGDVGEGARSVGRLRHDSNMPY